MRLVYESGGVERDLEMRAGRPDAVVGDLAEALGVGVGIHGGVRAGVGVGVGVGTATTGAGPGLWIDGRWCPPDVPLHESGIVEGARVGAADTERSVSVADQASHVLRVVGGLDAGAERRLGIGRVVLGRGRSDGVNLSSPVVSQAHCVVDVAADGTVTVADLGSANGTDVNGTRLRGPRRVTAGDLVGLGGGVAIQILPAEELSPVRRLNPAREVRAGGTLPFTRPPRPAPPPAHQPVTLPTPPKNAHRAPFSLGQILGPLLLAAGIVAMTKQWAYAAFAALTPIMFLTNFVEERTRGRLSLRRGRREYHAALEQAARELAQRHTTERAWRYAAVIDPAEAAHRAAEPGLRLWERRPGAEDFLQVSVGVADQLWHPPVVLPVADLGGSGGPGGSGKSGGPEDAVAALLAEVSVLPQVPVPVALGPGEAVGLQGHREAVLSVARSLLCQAVVGSGPADLTVAVFTDPDRLADWDWTKWLPHGADRRSGSAHLVACGPQEWETLARALATDRAENATPASGLGVVGVAGGGTADGAGGPGRPALLVIADGAVLLEGRPNPLRDLLSGTAGSCGGIVITERLPALCTSIVTVDGDGRAEVEHVATGLVVRRVLACGMGEVAARRTARVLARFEDPELRVQGAGLPDQVTLLPLLGLPEVGAESVADRWRTAAETLRARATLGVTERDLFTVDLDDDGPHGLIAGTTGSGKSELLRTLIASLAVDAGPEHLTFVLVDYKGGGALDECAALPHVVGLVTDLDEQLGERALRCLEAELRHREHLLRDVGVGHVRDYQRLRGRERGDLEPMPRLVIVIDEFATLVKALPDFVDALVSIAQRGRSLGMHLIMATQRPSGSVSDAIKNNVKLRIALRVESTSDSQDVIDGNAAAGIGSRQWGRAYYRLSAKESVPVQTALSTGITGGGREHAAVTLVPFFLGMLPAGHGDPDEEGETDLRRLVSACGRARLLAGLGEPRRPWPEQLPAVVRASDTPPTAERGMQTSAPVSPGSPGLPTLALADDPDRQRQYPVGWDPAAGNLLIYGSVGSGTSATLLALALGLAGATSPDRLHLYVVDMGAGELAPLADLPHTGAHVGAAERERLVRLIRLLREELDVRKARAASSPAAPDWLILVDNAAALVSEFDKDVAGLNLMDDFQRVFADGPAVGLRFAVTGDRHGAVPSAWAALVQQKLLLRLADPGEYSYFDIRSKEVPQSTPGRAVVAATKQVVQIVWTGSDTPAAVARVCERWRGCVRSAARVGTLPALVPVSAADEPAATGTEPWHLPLGMADSTLSTIGVDLYEHEHLLVAGPQRSGRSTVLVRIALAVLAQPDPPAVVAFAPRRSPLRDVTGLTASVQRYEALEEVLEQHAEGPMMLLVDDAETVEETPGVLSAWLASAGVGRHLVAAGRAEGVRRAFGHWTQKVKESHTGVLLCPDHDLDGDLLGVILPRTGRMASMPGRGYLVADGTVTGLQVALPDR